MMVTLDVPTLSAAIERLRRNVEEDINGGADPEEGYDQSEYVELQNDIDAEINRMSNVELLQALLAAARDEEEEINQATF